MDRKTELKNLLINCLGMTDIKYEDIADDAILFGTDSVLDLDSIDAVSFSAEIRNVYDIPTTISIGLNDFVTINATLEWLTCLNIFTA